MIHPQIGGHSSAHQSAAVVVESLAERGKARQHDVDNALGRIGEQILGQTEQDATVSGDFDPRSLARGE
jgi:hypothetical protein